MKYFTSLYLPFEKKYKRSGNLSCQKFIDPGYRNNINLFIEEIFSRAVFLPHQRNSS